MQYLGEMVKSNINLSLTNVEMNLVGPGIGEGITSTKELCMINYNKILQSDHARQKSKWVANEKEWLNKYNALTPV